jgi:hypothetical protein
VKKGKCMVVTKNWKDGRAIFEGKLLTCEDKSFVACRQIFSEVSSPAYELQVINSRLCYEIKLVELGR